MEKEKNERYVYCYEPYDGDSFIWDTKKDSKIEDLSECANVMNTLNEETERWKAHKEYDRQINLEQSRTIEQLEEKLEEKEFELKELHSAYRDLEKIVDDNYEEFEKRFAKKQKEETIKTLERMLDDLRRK